jgi:hypothetical protein
VAPTRPEERVLEHGLRGVEVVEKLAQRDAGTTGQRILDGPHAEEAAELRLSDDPLEGIVVERVGEVGECAGR